MRFFLNSRLKKYMRPIHRGILEFAGFTVLAPHVVYGPARMSKVEIGAELEKYGARLRNIGEEAPFIVGSY